ncbi:MAG TPA: hypothetical protein VNS32_11435 [Flavisolibacter sp.]|nr:hypothetical protein [Flavisolibacter sp.]
MKFGFSSMFISYKDQRKYCFSEAMVSNQVFDSLVSYDSEFVALEEKSFIKRDRQSA